MRSGILFVGTGASSGTPQLAHVLAAHAQAHPAPSNAPAESDPSGQVRNCPSSSQEPCKVCLDAFSNPSGLNHRNNVSIAINFCRGESPKTVLVDCGKTFRDAALRTLVQNGILLIDAVFLTHDHQDAIAGLDDIRELQRFNRVPGSNGKSWYLAEKILPIRTGKKTATALSKKFEYFVSIRHPMPTKIPVVAIEAIEETGGPQEFEVEQVRMTALPIEHGSGYTCLGLSFGSKDAAVLYLSDVSAIPPDVEEYVKSLGTVKVLIIDAINYNRRHSSHFCLEESLGVVERWQPEMAYMVGMSCSIDHEEGCTYLQNWLSEKRQSDEGFRTQYVSLAHDGLFVPLDI